MRIGEIRNIIKSVTSETGELVVKSDPIYGGQAFTVRDFKSLVDALNVISKESWNTLGFDEVDAIIKKFPTIPVAANLNLEDHTKLLAYIQSVNTKMPIFVSVIESLAQEQNEQVINIKLPDKYKSLSDLTTLNNRLTTLLKVITIDGDVEFVGFDKGSDWYIICLVGVETYRAFIASLDIAQKFFIAKKEYFDSKKAELDYRAGLPKSEEFTKEGLKVYQDKRMDLDLENQANDVVASITDPNGHAQPELLTKIVTEVKGLVKEMGEGVEFHLSLNPPNYVKTEGGLLTIDYKKIAEQNTKKLSTDTKQLETPKDKPTGP